MADNRLEIEKLVDGDRVAEAASPEAYKTYTETVDKNAAELQVKRKEEAEAEDNPPPMDDDAPLDGEITDDPDAPADGDAETEGGNGADAEDSGEPEATMESRIKSFESFTTPSSMMTNLTELVQGLANIGIKYGPLLLSVMYKGVIWAFSRLGMLVADTANYASSKAEAIFKSATLLNRRLNEHEAFLNAQDLEPNAKIEGEYKDVRIITLLSVGNSFEFGSNLKRFSEQMSREANSIANEINRGYTVIEDIASTRSAGRDKADIAKLMEIIPSNLQMVPRELDTLSFDKDLVTSYQSREAYPGNVVLGFLCPNTANRDIDGLRSSYGASLMAIVRTADSPAVKATTRYLSAREQRELIQSTRALIAQIQSVGDNCKWVASKRPGVTMAIKRLFAKLADESAKTRLGESLIEPIYLRAALTSTVFLPGSVELTVHASRVAAAAVKFLEDHRSKML